MANTRRIYRVAEQVKTNVAMQLQRVADPRFELVTITSVQISGDLRYASVYWTAFRGIAGKGESTEAMIKDVVTAFDGARGMFKRELAKELGMRNVPELVFYYDDTFDVLEQTENLLSEINQDE